MIVCTVCFKWNVASQERLPLIRSIGTTLSAIYFQGWLIQQVRCYTLHSGFRLQWLSLSTNTTTMVSDELNRTFGSSNSASSAYQTCPTRYTHSNGLAPFKRSKLLTHLKFENLPRDTCRGVGAWGELNSVTHFATLFCPCLTLVSLNSTLLTSLFAPPIIYPVQAGKQFF